MKTIEDLAKDINQNINFLISEISFHPDKRIETFLALNKEDRIALLHKLPNHVKKDVITHLSEEELIGILEAIDPDEATDLLQLLNPHKRAKVLEDLSLDLKNTISMLLSFDPDTAAGLMNMDYVQVETTDTIADVAKKFKLHEKRTGRLPIILVLENSSLMGFLPGHQIAFGKLNEKVKKYVKRIPVIRFSASHEEVIDLFRAHPHGKVAVVDNENKVIGMIFSDDVLQLIHKQETDSLYDFAGVSEEEGIADPARLKIKHRYKWLVINLGTAFLAAFTVGLFEETISKYVLLAVYMPIVAGMGGNAATQTLAVVVRGIALKQIELKSALYTLKNEAAAGLFNGFFNGLLVAVIVILKDGDLKLAIVLALAMAINLLVAAVFGTVVPLVMSRLKKDPASSATIFITTATDVLGFLAFLGLATIILG